MSFISYILSVDSGRFADALISCFTAPLTIPFTLPSLALSSFLSPFLGKVWPAKPLTGPTYDDNYSWSKFTRITQFYT